MFKFNEGRGFNMRYSFLFINSLSPVLCRFKGAAVCGKGHRIPSEGVPSSSHIPQYVGAQ